MQDAAKTLGELLTAAGLRHEVERGARGWPLAHFAYEGPTGEGVLMTAELEGRIFRLTSYGHGKPQDPSLARLDGLNRAWGFGRYTRSGATGLVDATAAVLMGKPLPPELLTELVEHMADAGAALEQDRPPKLALSGDAGLYPEQVQAALAMLGVQAGRTAEGAVICRFKAGPARPPLLVEFFAEGGLELVVRARFPTEHTLAIDEAVRERVNGFNEDLDFGTLVFFDDPGFVAWVGTVLVPWAPVEPGMLQELIERADVVMRGVAGLGSQDPA